MSIHCAPSSPSKRSGCYFADLVVSLPYNLPLEPLQNPEMSPVPLVDRTTEITFYNHLASPRTSSFLSSAAAFSPLYRQEAFKCVDAEGRVEAWTFAANVWVPIPDPDLDALVLGEWAGIVTLVAPAGKDETWEIKLLYVIPHARNKGVGTRLLEAAVGYGVRQSRARGMGRVGFRIVVACGMGVMGWYERLGWRVGRVDGAMVEMERWVGGVERPLRSEDEVGLREIKG